VIYQTLDEPIGNDELKGRFDIPQTLEEFMVKMKEGGYDAKTFAVKLREMVQHCPLLFPCSHCLHALTQSAHL